MTEQDLNSPITVSEEWLAAYIGDSLSEGKELAIACQASINEKAAREIGSLYETAGAILETAPVAELTEEFGSRLLDRLDQAPETLPTAQPAESSENWLPAPLRDWLTAREIEVDWKFAGKGVEQALLAKGENGELVYLLRAAPGTIMPEHGHRGEEWTLILNGSYTVDGTFYGAGDLHQENEKTIHQPVISDGEECICLVVIDGKLKFPQIWMRMLQPFFGI